MISLVGDFKTPPVSVLKSIYGDVAEEIVEYAAKITQTIEESDDIEFAIPLNVKLVFAKDDDDGAQIILTKAEEGMSGLKNALVLEKSVSVDKTHPHLQNDAIKVINQRLTEKYDGDKLKQCLPCIDKYGKPALNTNCFQSLIHKLKWKNGNNKFHHFIAKPQAHLYSDYAIDEIINKIINNNDYLKEAKKSYSCRKKK
jgi:hypothetical protein